jgi:hypothetical protein
MPRFFFNHTSCQGVSVDDTGTDFPSLEAAYLDTCNAILDISYDKLRERCDPTDDIFEIVSEHGDLLVTIPFSEVLRPHQPEDHPGSRTVQLTSTSARLTKRHRTLRAQINEELARTEAMFCSIRSNLTRLDAACSAHWPRPK